MSRYPNIPSWYVPIQSMYGIFSLHLLDWYGKCGKIYHTWMVWVVSYRGICPNFPINQPLVFRVFPWPPSFQGPQLVSQCHHQFLGMFNHLLFQQLVGTSLNTNHLESSTKVDMSLKMYTFSIKQKTTKTSGYPFEMLKKQVFLHGFPQGENPSHFSWRLDAPISAAQVSISFATACGMLDAGPCSKTLLKTI